MKLFKNNIPLIMCLLSMFALLISGQDAFAVNAKSTVGITFEGTASTTTSSSDDQTKDSTSDTEKSGEANESHNGVFPKTGEVDQDLSQYGLFLIIGLLFVVVFKMKGRKE